MSSTKRRFRLLTAPHAHDPRLVARLANPDSTSFLYRSTLGRAVIFTTFASGDYDTDTLGISPEDFLGTTDADWEIMEGVVPNFPQPANPVHKLHGLLFSRIGGIERVVLPQAELEVEIETADNCGTAVIAHPTSDTAHPKRPIFKNHRYRHFSSRRELIAALDEELSVATGQPLDPYPAGPTIREWENYANHGNVFEGQAVPFEDTFNNRIDIDYQVEFRIRPDPGWFAFGGDESWGFDLGPFGSPYTAWQHGRAAATATKEVSYD